MKVAHLTTNHAPLDTRIFLKECRTLAAAGYDVVLIVPHDSDEKRDGVSIHVVAMPKNRRERLLRSGWLVYRRALAARADVYHLHDSELIPFAWLLKLRGARVIFDAHEDRPKQIMSKPWIRADLRPTVAAITRYVEAASALLFDRVVAATPAIAANFPARKTWLVQNFPIRDELVFDEGLPYPDRPKRIGFVGGITEIRGIQQMIAAMAHLEGEDEDVELVLVGRFDPPTLEDDVRHLPGWRRVRAVGWQSRASVAQTLASLRAGLLLYHPVPNHVDAQPNKLFEYMSAGIPVIASDFPLWRSIIDEAGCGLLVDPLDPVAIAGAISWILGHPQEAHEMGERGRDSVASRFNWDREATALLAMYAELRT